MKKLLFVLIAYISFGSFSVQTETEQYVAGTLLVGSIASLCKDIADAHAAYKKIPIQNKPNQQSSFSEFYVERLKAGKQNLSLFSTLFGIGSAWYLWQGSTQETNNTTQKKSTKNSSSHTHTQQPNASQQKTNASTSNAQSNRSLFTEQRVGNDYHLVAPVPLHELTQPQNYAALDAIFLRIAEIAQTEKQFTLHARTVGTTTTWVLDPKSRSEDASAHHSAQCPFCAMIKDHSKGYVVAENDGALGFFSLSTLRRINNPAKITPKCLIIPKKPIVNMGSVTAADLEALHAMATMTQELVAQYPEYKKFELEMHNGSAGYQTVFHLHWHFTIPGVSRTVAESFKKI